MPSYDYCIAHTGTRVLVMDSMTGLVVGSLAYRMRGQGLILALYGSQQPHLEMVNMFNLDNQSLSIIQVMYVGVLVTYHVLMSVVGFECVEMCKSSPRYTLISCSTVAIIMLI